MSRPQAQTPRFTILAWFTGASHAGKAAGIDGHDVVTVYRSHRFLSASRSTENRVSCGASALVSPSTTGTSGALFGAGQLRRHNHAELVDQASAHQHPVQGATGVGLHLSHPVAAGQMLECGGQVDLVGTDHRVLDVVAEPVQPAQPAAAVDDHQPGPKITDGG